MSLGAARPLPRELLAPAVRPFEQTPSTDTGPADAGHAPGQPQLLAELAAPGRLVELSGVGAGARTTTAVSLLRAAQREGEPAAWVQVQGGALFPPDLADSGVDLEALTVVHVPRGQAPHGLCRAGELLLRSGAFGLLVLDLSTERGRFAPRPHDQAWQGRLLALARKHESRLVVMTHKPEHEGSLGPLVGLRIETHRERTGPGTFTVEYRLLKNKSGAPARPGPEARRGPWGLE